MNTRKNLSGVQSQDIILRWLHEDQHGNDVYAVHMLANYRMGAVPLGTATYCPSSRQMTFNMPKVITRMQAVGPAD
jgi:hypothetical protein